MDLRVFDKTEGKKGLLDTTRFNDPVAFHISWLPVSSRPTSFCTHRAKVETELSGKKVKFQVSQELFFYLYVLLAGVLLMFAPNIYQFVVSRELGSSFFLLFCACLYVIRRSLRFFRARRDMVSEFDLSSGSLIQGNSRYDLSEMHAIQLFKKGYKVTSQIGCFKPFYYFEMNLVLNNCTRINIVDHGSLVDIRKDAGLLAFYLNVPVWDAINYELPE